ncbi:MAG: CBS domain-containing protein [Nitrospirae bacterium]|nr:CBS domain-containing protein [Nitrospirota bacterium]
MKNLKATDIMKRNVTSAKKNDPAKDIAMQLVSGLFSGMPITDDKGRVIGVVTEHDLLNQVREEKDLLKLTAEDVMQKNPITVDVNTPLIHVLDIMLENGILRIPVTDGLHLVGIISRSDILKTILSSN